MQLRREEIDEDIKMLLEQALNHLPLADVEDLRIEVLDCYGRLDHMSNLIEKATSEDISDIEELRSVLMEIQNRFWVLDRPLDNEHELTIVRIEVRLLLQLILKKQELLQQLLNSADNDDRELVFLSSIYEELQAQCKALDNQYTQLCQGLRTLQKQNFTIDLWLYDLKRRLSRWTSFITNPDGRMALDVLRDCEVRNMN